MTITKLGHCCLLVEEKGVRIMTDPGSYSTRQNDVTNINFIFITHEHADHLHLESLRVVLEKNPRAKVVTNHAVGEILKKENIPFELLGDGEVREFGGVKISGHGTKHAPIYPGWREVINTGYFFGDRFFYPGDAFYNPNRLVEILALPIAGPWLKISEAIDYAKALRPKVVFPVHDGMLKFNAPTRAIPKTFLEPLGIRFVPCEDGEVVNDPILKDGT